MFKTWVGAVCGIQPEYWATQSVGRSFRYVARSNTSVAESPVKPMIYDSSQAHSLSTSLFHSFGHAEKKQQDLISEVVVQYVCCV